MKEMMTLSNSTTEKLPDLTSEYEFSNEQIESYQRDGNIFLGGVASEDEIAIYRPVINDVVMRLNTETRPLEDRDTYGKAFLQTENLWVHSKAVAKFTLARRFGKIAADLMSVRGVRIYHDQALYKEPGGGATPFHQDQYYWPLSNSNTITMWMPLVPVPEEVGSMTFGVGSHRLGYLGELPISDKSEAVLQDFIRERGIETFSYGSMRPGDTTWHSGWTLHGAKGNPTPTTREVMTIIFMDADMLAIEPDNDNRVADLAAWMPGVEPGELCASPLNPIVYRRD